VRFLITIRDFGQGGREGATGAGTGGLYSRAYPTTKAIITNNTIIPIISPLLGLGFGGSIYYLHNKFIFTNPCVTDVFSTLFYGKPCVERLRVTPVFVLTEWAEKYP